MVENHSVKQAFACLVVILFAGCMDAGVSDKDNNDSGTPPSPVDGTPPPQSDDTPPPNSLANTTRSFSLEGCDHAEFIIVSASAGFPYAAPEGWAESSADLDDAVLARMFACEHASVFGMQSFDNVSMFWIGHGNMSDAGDRLEEYYYTELVGEVVIAAEPPEFADALRDEFDVAPGRVVIEDDTAVMESPDGRLSLDLVPVRPPGGTVHRETMFFVNATGERWMEVEQAHDSDGIWLPGTLSREGQTPLDPWFDAAHNVPVADGYLARNGTVEVTIFG